MTVSSAVFTQFYYVKRISSVTTHPQPHWDEPNLTKISDQLTFGAKLLVRFVF